MKIVVTGGRDFRDAALIARALAAVHRKHGITKLIQGGASGADRLSAEWGWENSIPVATFNAEWKAQGKRAGPIRNQRMIDEGAPDAAIVFPGGDGTADMARRLANAGIPVWDLR